MPCLLCWSFVAGLAGVRSPMGARLPSGPGWALAVLMALPWTGTALAQAPFHQDKQLVIVINYPLGGPTDTEGRLLARHLGRHIPGHPTVIVKNMGGSAGALGPDWLANTAVPDGLVIGYFTGAATRATLEGAAFRADLGKLAFIAAAGGISVTYARTDIGGGIKKPSDLLTKKDFWVGGIAPENDRDVRTRMQLDLLGAKYRYLTGFPGAADARVAFQRGEVQVFMESLLNYRSSIEPGPVTEKTALPLWFDPVDDGDGFQRSPDAEGIPALTFTDFLIKMRGEPPKSELFDAWRLVNLVSTQYLRIVTMAPGTPKDAMVAIQQAIAKLAGDAEYKEDSQKSIKSVLRFAGDERTAQRFQQLLTPEPRVQAVIRDYVDKLKADAPK